MRRALHACCAYELISNAGARLLRQPLRAQSLEASSRQRVVKRKWTYEFMSPGDKLARICLPSFGLTSQAYDIKMRLGHRSSLIIDKAFNRITDIDREEGRSCQKSLGSRLPLASACSRLMNAARSYPASMGNRN